MKKILIAVLLFIGINGFSQNDPAAKKMLDAVSAKIKGMKTVQANYVLTVTTRAGKNAGTKSGVISSKGQKYSITTSDLQIFCDGKKIWKYEPAANEVTVSSVEANSKAFTPQKIFTNFYDKDFLYKLNGTKTINGKKLSEIEMTPTNKNQTFFKIYLYIDPTQNMIVSAKSLENSGNTYTYTMSNLKSNITLPDSQFTFDKTKHPGVEEIDQ